MGYDEPQVLIDYVWENYPELLTDFEHLVGAAIREMQPPPISSSPRDAPPALNDVAWRTDPEVTAALQVGAQAYRRQVAERLLAAYPDRIKIARCPKCHRIARRPDAKVCFWCGHDWHQR